MNLLSEITAAQWISLGPRIVGATFVWTAVIKAIAPQTFRQHLSSLGWIPDRLLWPAVVGAAAFEAGWGVALILGIAPAIVLPATLVLLVVFSAISWWGVRSGKAADCGCYGGFIHPSIAQSIGLNSAFAALVLAAWFAPMPATPMSLWMVFVAIAATLVTGGLAEFARRYPDKHGHALFDLNPLKVGRKWRHSWSGGATSGNISDEMLVAYLGPDCPYCTKFVTLANAMIQSPRLPRVVGVVGSSRERLNSFIADKGIRFPMATISPSLMGRLAQAVPTAVLVKSGKIDRIWIGNMPADFVDRFRRAFFPDPDPAAAPQTT
ncbi:MAG: MauE/DoxX family redox-associated membrane protein [Gemmatimonadaceae bacterium]